MVLRDEVNLSCIDSAYKSELFNGEFTMQTDITNPAKVKDSATITEVLKGESIPLE